MEKEKTNQNNNPQNNEISFYLKGIYDLKGNSIETEKNIRINIENNIENNKIKFRIEHEIGIKVYESKFEMEELKYNYFFQNLNNIEQVFNKIKLLLENKENTFKVETNLLNLILFDNDNQICFHIKEIDNNNQNEIN